MSSSIRLSPPGKFVGGVFERADIESLLAAEPTAYGTWNPADVESRISITQTTLLNDTFVGTEGGNPSTGKAQPIMLAPHKYVWETKNLTYSRAVGWGVGMQISTQPNQYNAGLGGSVGQMGISGSGSGTIYADGSIVLAGIGRASGDIDTFAFDASTRQFWIGHNGSWVQGDPALGTGELGILSAGSYVPGAWAEGGCSVQINTGENAFFNTLADDLIAVGFRKVGTY